MLAYSRSLHAMTVTSITDSAAFFANVLSSIPVCRVFGVFMGILILVDFAICLTYFPAVVILHHRWLSARSKHGCFKRWLSWGKAQQLLNEAASQQSSSCSEWQTEMQPPPTEFTPHSSGPIEPKPAVEDAPPAGLTTDSTPAPPLPFPPFARASWTCRVEELMGSWWLPLLHRWRRAVLFFSAVLAVGSVWTLTQSEWNIPPQSESTPPNFPSHPPFQCI